ncbi:uncharacterized protein LOC129599171 [Paramacrobiotus metropolitanus]|uniref:uncharacterized protein LOC129599171 n=1 Tax=Paramacrobiotus metropolitanus TaxID=2943436 RepID=UPI0024465D6C|nr:uncharacterized protein LOC129599171 [Paramacrobiotus metropolitanus]
MTLSAVEFWNYFPVVCFWITTVPFVFTCSVSRAGRIEQLVQAAEQQIQDDIILLPMPNLPPLNPGIVHTTVGRTAVFSCSAPTQEADTGAPQIVWRHRNITIHTDHTVPASMPFNYTRREDNGNHYLSIHNITPLDPYGVSIITTAKCFF